MADSKKYDGSQWEHSLRKLTTATEAVENPLYSDGTAITAYTLKGNTVQNGTPTPSNPVEVNGVGNKTTNKFNKNATNTANGYVANSHLNGGTVESNSECNVSEYIPVDGATTYTMSGFYAGWSSSLVYYDTSKSIISYRMYENKRVLTFTTPANAAYIRITISKPDIDSTMINDGNEALPYEGFGYKIPISSGGVTTNIYLGSTQTVRQVKKLVLTGDENWNENLTNYGYRFGLNVSDSMQSDTQDVRSLCTHLSLTVRGGTGLDVQNVYVISASNDLIIKLSNSDRVSDLKTWLAQQYAAGTPVIVWYVLATPTTAAVNEPLMKIGDYTDTLSNAASIPTTEGANSITVDTTVQPSEFTATWTGWHNANVKEWDGSQWD